MYDNDTSRGSSAPIGATVLPGGVNFSVFSKHATRVDLLLFESDCALKPAKIISLDPRRNRTYHYWHIFVPNLKAGQVYGYNVHGPAAPERGLRFDSEKVLLDPYGLSVSIPDSYEREAARLPGNNAAHSMKSVVVEPGRYDWEGDNPIRRPFAETVIYELHIDAFTRHHSSGVSASKRGTYAGLIEKIPYLKELGITAVELLPVFQFDRYDAPRGRVNYWGYQPVSFFAPHQAYSSKKDAQGVINEFRDMVKALHRAGIEVILDVVFNHTSEGNHDGPTFCFRGFANEFYYILEKDKSRYADFTGCGNTLNANQPIVRRMIQDSLRYWVTHMHVDGFRFDLASILSRDESGNSLPNPPILWDIESDPELAGTKLIAEAWDAAGLYQVGSFVGDTWQEWNGKFRDDIRRFWRGDKGTVGVLASRLLGSPDIYGRDAREAEQSVNFVTCHDGFTLNDLVSYNQKHNEANGENNRDGTDDNLSWNCGVEGPCDDPQIEAIRNRQIKNYLAILLISVGTPMLLMGDEARRSQQGNNNAFCQDGELSWFNWDALKSHAEIHRFVKELCAFRQRRDVVVEESLLGLNQLLDCAKIQWHGVKLNSPDWSEDSRSLAVTLQSIHARFIFHVMFNAFWEPLVFELPPIAGTSKNYWRRCLDTALHPPHDISRWDKAALVQDETYVVQPRSTVFLACRLSTDANPSSKS